MTDARPASLSKMSLGSPSRTMNETPSAAQALSRTLGYTFRDTALLESALVHTSYVNERPGRGLERSLSSH